MPDEGTSTPVGSDCDRRRTLMKRHVPQPISDVRSQTSLSKLKLRSAYYTTIDPSLGKRSRRSPSCFTMKSSKTWALFRARARTSGLKKHDRFVTMTKDGKSFLVEKMTSQQKQSSRSISPL